MSVRKLGDFDDPSSGGSRVVSAMRPVSREGGVQRSLSQVLVLFYLIDIARAYYPDYTIYHDVDRFNKEVQELAKQWPKLITLEQTEHSRDGHPLYLLRLTGDQPSDGKRKINILITFGEHSREFVPVESFFKLVRELCSKYEQQEEVTKFILEHVNLLLIGLVNPDGRKYLERNRDFCWRGMANSVDVNRNFDWEWGGPGSSGNKKSEEYRGEQPFSEPESRFVRDIAKKAQLDAYLSMHTGAQYIFCPYGDSKSKRSKRRHPLTREQLSLGNALWAASDGFFTGVGSVNDMNDYTADGTIADWVSGVLKVPFVLTFELFGVPGDLPNCFEQFNPHSNHLQPTLQHFHPLYNAAFLFLVNHYTHAVPPLSVQLQPSPSAVTWEFAQGVDSPEGDLYHADLTKNMADRVDMMKEMCALRADCAGFHSSGWFKKSIQPKEARKAVHSRGSEEGLYIKVAKAGAANPWEKTQLLGGSEAAASLGGGGGDHGSGAARAGGGGEGGSGSGAKGVEVVMAELAEASEELRELRQHALGLQRAMRELVARGAAVAG